MKIILVALGIVIIAVSVGAFTIKGPIHAQCKVKWTWPNTECGEVLKKLLNQIDAWKTADNCKNGGEKCLYSLVSSTLNSIKAKHMTPVKKYVDDLTFSFENDGKTCNANVRFKKKIF